MSWLFSGNIEHRDSAGHHVIVKPGELNLMTGGEGISHSERSTLDSEPLHGVQLWVALPVATMDVAKHFESYAPPLLEGPGWHGRVFLGSALGQVSPVTTYSPLLGAELNLDPGMELVIPVDPTFEHGVLVDTGQVELSALGPDATSVIEVRKDRLAYVRVGATELRVRARDEGARIMLLGGEPLDQETVMWWNFVGGTRDDIVQARRDWQAQIAKVGVEDPTPADSGRALHGTVKYGEGPVNHDRFGLPDKEPEPPLSAPPLPDVRLRPRVQD